VTLDISGPAAPPRSNGELVFREPWESRAFGLAVTLHAGGAFEWEDFRQELIAAVGRWEADHPSGVGWSYYRCWLEALERVLAAEGMVAPGDVGTRAQALAGRGADHGHRH
jgi:nitrile hydratase accessory protein